jgi:hypothetical protein
VPDKTRKQHNFMEMVKHSPEMQRRTGVSEKVADEFLQADKREGKFQQNSNPFISKTKK